VLKSSTSIPSASGNRRGTADQQPFPATPETHGNFSQARVGSYRAMEPEVSLDTAIQCFLTAKRGERCTERTIAQYGWTLRKFMQWLSQQGVVHPQDISPHHIRLFLSELVQRGCTAWYAHGFARVIKTWSGFLYGEGVIPIDPSINVRMPRLERKILPSFSVPEMEGLVASCRDARESAAVFTLLDTGIRATELAGLDIGDVDLKTGRLAVRKGKGQKWRIVFLGASARSALATYLTARVDAQSGDPLFPSATTGQRFSANGLLQFCRRLGRRAGVAHCAPHAFRRTFARSALRGGMDVESLRLLMGHADLHTLMQYVGTSEADLAEAHRRFGPVDGMLSGALVEDQPR